MVRLSRGGREVGREMGKLGRGGHVVRACTFQGFYFTFKNDLFVAVLGPHCSLAFSLVALSGGSSPVAVGRLLILMASLVADRRFWGPRASRSGSWAPEHSLSTWGTRV